MHTVNNQKLRKQIMFVPVAAFIIITGCCDRQKTLSDTYVTGNEAYAAGKENTEYEEPEKEAAALEPIMAQLSIACQDIFEDTAAACTVDSLETSKRLVARIGENGYAAVDRKNQYNMVNAGRVLRFCEQAEEGEQSELTIIVVEETGGLTKYDIQADAGSLDIIKCYYLYEDGELARRSTYRYPADFWQYTEEGYFLFGGSYYSQEHYLYAMSDMTVCTALRVQPLEAKCREWNRRYILPVGYSKNDLFLRDWNEPDFEGLNFFDIFDKLYPIINGRPVPYRAAENLGVGAICRIPQEEFEHVILSRFQISPAMLRSKITFFTEDNTYEYKPRGLFEAESGNAPYPEVVGYQENGDGTVAFTVNAVYPDQHTSKAFAHETVIRPLPDGGFQYVSNRMIQALDNDKPTWRRERLTEERWEEFYGKK